MSVLSASRDAAAPIDALAVNAAAACLAASDIAASRVGAARLALVGDEVRAFPSDQEMDAARLSVFVAVNGRGRVLSMTAHTADGIVGESEVMRVVKEGVEIAKRFVGLNEQLREQVKELKEREGESAFPRQMPNPAGKREVEEVGEDVLEKIRTRARDLWQEAFVECRRYPGKAHRAMLVTNTQQALVNEFEQVPMDDVVETGRQVAREVFGEVLMRDGVRMDGRRFDEVRQVRCETAVLPGEVHGSALFERGDTQVLACSTIGMKAQAMKTEKYIAGGDEAKTFFVHYSFPPYATGDYGRFAGSASRREVGHSDLAEKALRPLLDISSGAKLDWPGNQSTEADDSQYPYVHRISAEVMASDGSSSMATVCAGSLALLHSGAPLREAVAGVAMGLVTGPQFEDGNDSDYVILSDILGAEDHYGAMDMKVTGTSEGITACQLDVKPHIGLPIQVLEDAFQEAKKARGTILDKMCEATKSPGKMPAFAPRVLEIPVDHELCVSTLMKNRCAGLRQLEEESGAELFYENRKQVIRVQAPNEESAISAARKIRKALGDLEIGSKLTGTVTEVKHTYAIVTTPGNISGVLHVSKMQQNPVGTSSRSGLTEEDETAENPFSPALRYPDARRVVSLGERVDVVVLESDRSKNILRFGLSSRRTSTQVDIDSEIESILSAAASQSVEVK